jgi:hypothetical protein
LDPSVIDILPKSWLPFLSLVPVIQVVAKLLAPLPGRVGGFSHSTIWSRFWDTVAAFPAAPASRPAPPISGDAG